MKKQPLFAIIMLAVIVVAMFAYLGGTGSLSVLGEESYQPYDPLLAAGSFDKTKWVSEAKPMIRQFYSCSGSTITDSQYDVYNYVQNMTFPTGVGLVIKFPSPPTVAYTGYSYKSPYSDVDGPQLAGKIRTKDLRLVNFKTEFAGVVGSCGSNAYSMGGVQLYTNMNNKTAVVDYPYGNRGATPRFAFGYLRGPSFVELTWDDYELGHYQVKVNGVIKQEGIVPEGQPFYLWTAATVPSCYSGSCTGAPAFINPRYKELFNCDPANGEYLVSKTFTKDQDFSLETLRGFSKFCTDFPAVHYKDGVISPSKQVYYALSTGKTVQPGANEIYKVFYIADGAALGLPVMSCSGGAFDFSLNKCVGLSGLADICGTGQQLINGICSVSAQNIIDLEPYQAVEGDDTILWTANPKLRQITSGATVLFSTATPGYTCQNTDGHSENDNFRYPRPDASCYDFEVNNKEVVVGSPVMMNDYFTLTMEKADVIIDYDVEDEHYGYVDSWQTINKMVLNGKPIVVKSNIASEYTLGSTASASLAITNSYPGTLSVTILREIKTPTGDMELKTQKTTVSSGTNSIMVKPYTAELSSISERVTVLMETSAGSLVASEPITIQYNIARGAAFCPDASTWNDDTSRCEYSSIGVTTCRSGFVLDSNAQVCYATEVATQEVVVHQSFISWWSSVWASIKSWFVV
jgi:hypothetical protein